MAARFSCPGACAIALATMMAAASCAPVAERSPDMARSVGDQCFLASQVTNFVGGDGKPLYFRARVSDVFQLSAPPCPGFDFARTLTIEPVVSVSDRLCVGDQVKLRPISSASLPSTCLTTIERRLSADDVKALPPGDRP